MEIKRAIEFSENIRDKISDLYVNGFYDVGLKHFSKDKSKIIEACLCFLLNIFLWQ